MTPKQIDLVQSSWTQVLPIAEAAAQMFYERLFTLDPTLRPLFKGDLKEQGRKLMTMITFVVKGLSRLESIVPGAQALGRRHAGYGVRDEHYATVAAALLWTLEQGLGDGFTQEVRDAWITAYGLLSNAMKDAARLAA
jgi:hemoglobin-like flavoprotein